MLKTTVKNIFKIIRSKFLLNLTNGPRCEKTCLRGLPDNTGAAAQSDQRLCYHLLESIIGKLDAGEISIL